MRAAATAAAVLFLLAVATACGSSHAGVVVTSDTAKTLYVTPNGSDGDGCTRDDPCRSLEHAYSVAHPGTTVVVAGGTYPNQDFEPDPAKNDGPNVVFEPAPGARVQLGELTLFASHLELRRMRVKGWTTEPSARHDVFRDVTAGFIFVHSSSFISVIGGSVGPGRNFDSQVAMASPEAPVPHAILIDGVTFHDWRLTRGSDAHVECFQVGEVNGLTIQNSRFVNCQVHNVFISPWFGGAERNVLLQNNVGGKVVAGYYGFRVAAGNETCGNIVFRYNSATSPYSIECGRIRGKVQLTANVGPYTSFACDSRFVYAYNVFDGARCGATDRNAPSGFVDPHTSNLHLTDRSAAIGHGDPRSFPATDIDGRKRTARRVDAGAYQPG